MNDTIPLGFCAYPSHPRRIGETIRAAVREINGGGTIRLKTWEEMRTGGKILVDEICSEINAAQLFCADLTGLNPNVMFELGYAIMQEKRIWPILDTTIEKSTKQFKAFQTLTSIGYKPYTNSRDIVCNYFQEQPDNDLHNSIYKQSIESHLSPSTSPSILYLKSRYADDASLLLDRHIKKLKVQTIVSDPQELAFQNLTWYGTNIYRASGVICHLTNPARAGAELDNCIYTLVAGMAYSLRQPLLMLIESDDDYLAPLDVRHILHKYQTAAEAESSFKVWLDAQEKSWLQAQAVQASNQVVKKLATELKELYFGDPLAENESERLDEYFVETAAYGDALEGKHLIFVGRKGSGKTANLLKIASTLEGPKTLVCKIQPVGYELKGLIDFLRKHKGLDIRGYAIESLWKFLVYSEVARATAEWIRSRPVQTRTKCESELIELIQGPDGTLEDFSVRLERCVKDLSNYQQAKRQGHSQEALPSAISEALHSGSIIQLRRSLAKVLAGTQRIAILIDNLDKAWNNQNDIDDLADFLLGLLNAANRILSDLKRDISSDGKINASLVIFLRSDIFNKVQEVALEPDKIQYFRLIWNDKEDLLRIIEERFVASHDNSVSPDEMWERYFCEEVNGTPTAEYLASHILPRPRDLILFVSHAVRTAVSHKHTKVEEKDILEAEREVSQNAVKSILVENSSEIPDLESILYEFTGSTPYLTGEEVKGIIESNAGQYAGRSDEVVNLLLNLNFLGVEVDSNDFRFPEDPQELRKNKIMARNFARRDNRKPRYKIHPAFWAFLEIRE